MKRATLFTVGMVAALGGLILPGLFGSVGAALPSVSFPLRASTPQIAQCLPNAQARVTVQLTTDSIGFDSFHIQASGLKRNTAYTVFLIQTPGTPFGAAEYIGDFFTNREGEGANTFRLIVAEAFSSTLVGSTRVRKELNSVGFWFADPAADNFCLGANSPPTPFDGDNAAGVQVMNSGAHHLPPP